MSRKLFLQCLGALLIVAPLVAQQPADAGDLDREQFAKSARSIARPDLLACRNLDAKIDQPRDLNPEEFGKSLTGVWLGRRTVHGISIDMDTAFYIKMNGTKGMAVLIDRDNLKTNTFAKNLGRVRKPAAPLMMSYVNCRYQFVDQYVKVTDEVPMDALGKATGVKLAATTNLKQAWEAISKAGYFKNPKFVPTAKLGDGSRTATLPTGTVTTEKRIAAGYDPGAEYYLPMVVGGYFDISLTPVTSGQARGVHMRFDAEYRGAGINTGLDELTFGFEEGDFFGQAIGDPAAALANDPVAHVGAWRTSSCGEKNGLATPGMTFERFVIAQ